VSRVLLPLPVMLPLLGAGATLIAGRHPRLQRLISIAVLVGMVVVSATLLVLVDRDGPMTVDVGGWPTTVGITLVADRLSALMLVVSSTVLLFVLLYAIGQGTADGDEETPISIFNPTYLVLAAGVANAFLAGDLFNLYVGFEVLLTASYVLLTLGGTGPRVKAGITYVVVSLLSSLVFLAGIAFVYMATGTLNIAQIAERMGDVHDGTRLAICLVLLVAFGIKAAVFPLSAWLPDSYPTAAAPVTAVFAGLLTKVGVYAIIRMQTLMFPDEGLENVLLVVALATMLVGVLGAVAQTDLKRMLSFTLVSHIGFMLFGIGLASVAGLAGAIYYVVHHIVIQTTLFLSTGLVERLGGSARIDRLGGLAVMSPLLAVLFFVPAMNLSGIPPLSGFIGKLGVIEAGAQDGGGLAWLLVGGSVVTSLLTLFAIAKAWSKAFWRPLDQVEVDASEVADAAGVDAVPGVPAAGAPAAAGAAVRARLPRTMALSTAAMVVVGLGLTVAAGPVYRYAERAAVEVHDREAYVDAVLRGDTAPADALLTDDAVTDGAP
jgi:multicomponent Na+:H+ antiporter subunit D